MPVTAKLTIWTIYRSPSDHPGKWVVRGHDIDRDGPLHREDCVVAESLEAAREALPPGLHCLGRQPADDPVIYESWV